MRLDFLAAISGVMIALQARANGELSNRLNNGLQAALISFGSGFIIIAVIALFHSGIKTGIENLRIAVRSKSLPRWALFAGMLGGMFVGLQTQMVPLLGVAIYSVASLAGQTATSLLIDRIGLTGGGIKQISARRIAASLVTVLAVLISVLDRIDASDLSLWAVFFAGVAGGVVGIQRALNGQINEFSGQSFTTSLLNFLMGTTFLAILFLVGIAFGKTEFVSIPPGPWWMYTGGTIGVIYIAFTSTIVQHLGVLTFTLFSVGGNLFGSLLIDLVSPTDGVRVSWYLVAGIIFSYLGVIVGGVSNSSTPKSAKPK